LLGPNQLRVADERIKTFRDYQMRKTCNVYSNSNRGIIKCPNQKCKWIAEDEYPNERFKVQCPLCTREFCSLCNQQYHYRTKCRTLLQITQQWFLWCKSSLNFHHFIFIINLIFFRTNSVFHHARTRRCGLYC
jgi:hypothetical protein